MAADAVINDTGRMDSILIYCRPRDSGRGHTLRAWLARQAAELSARPEVERPARRHHRTGRPVSAPRAMYATRWVSYQSGPRFGTFVQQPPSGKGATRVAIDGASMAQTRTLVG